MGKLAATHLRATGVRSVRVANRSPQAARELAAHFHGEAVPFEELTKWAARSEIVITSTGSYELLVDYARAQQIMQERKNTPIVFIDISVPRNVDPNVGTIDNVFYYDVDDLGAVVEANLQERRKEAALAEKIVEQEVDSFCARLHSLDMAPVVVELQTRIQEICQVELDRFFKKAGPRDPQERRELEVMISRIAGKIAHPLITPAGGGPRHPEADIQAPEGFGKLRLKQRHWPQSHGEKPATNFTNYTKNRLAVPGVFS